MATTSNSTFGTTEAARHIYFTRVVPFLNLADTKTRFRILAGSLDPLNHKYSNPTPVSPERSPDNLGYLELYALHTNPSTSSTTITKLFNASERQHLPTDPLGLENLLRVIYADIPATALTPSDRDMLNLPKKKAKTAHRVATKNTVVWTSKGLGGGDVLTKCSPSGGAILNPSAATARGTSKSNRPHKEAGYNIRTWWIVIENGAAVPTSHEAAGMTVTTETRAQSVRHLGAANEGKRLVEFKQWHDDKHTDLDGPVSITPVVTRIT